MIKSVFVGIPIHRQWSRESQACFEDNLQNQRGWKLHTLYRHYGESLIQRARHNIMLKFLESGADFLLFLDDDVCLITPTTIEMLVAAREDIIGGIYIMKGPPHSPVYLPFSYEYPDVRYLNEPFHVRYASTGCMLISRHAVNKIYRQNSYPWECFETKILKWKADKTTVEETIYLSEDWAFCERAARERINTYIHPVPVIGHIGNYIYGLADWYAMLERKKEK